MGLFGIFKKDKKIKYYFVICEIHDKHWNHDPSANTTGGNQQLPIIKQGKQCIISIHSLVLQKEYNIRFNKTHKHDNYYRSRHMMVLNWVEISKLEYENFNNTKHLTQMDL